MNDEEPKLSWKEIYALGEKYYSYGGHVIVDNWTEASFNAYVAEHGPVTRPIALLLFSGIPGKDWDTPKNGLTWEQALELARENYDAGGYSISDFWGRREYEDYVHCFGPVTYRKLFTLFSRLYDEADAPEERCARPYNPVLNWEEFLDVAQKNYSRGGDVFAECWDRARFDEYVKEFGPVTLMKAARMIADNADVEDEQRAVMRQVIAGEW